MRGRNPEAAYLSPPYQRDMKARGLHDTDSPADSLLDLYGTSKPEKTEDFQKSAVAHDSFGDSSQEEDSKWIHRDKLAKIESEELQAAGIILPKAREGEVEEPE